MSEEKSLAQQASDLAWQQWERLHKPITDDMPEVGERLNIPVLPPKEQSMSENQQLWEIVRAVAQADTTWEGNSGDIYCIFCMLSLGDRQYLHEPDCIFMKACTLVEQAKKLSE